MRLKDEDNLPEKSDISLQTCSELIHTSASDLKPPPCFCSSQNHGSCSSMNPEASRPLVHLKASFPETNVSLSFVPSAYATVVGRYLIRFSCGVVRGEG